MKTIYKLMGALVMLALMTACSNFDDLNTDPNKTTTGNASMLCTNVILRIANTSGDAKSVIGKHALPKYVGYANEGQMGEQYNLIGNGSFGAMTMLPHVTEMLKYAQNNPMEKSYQGVGAFARAYMFYYLAMEMGDVPCSASNLGAEGDFTPTYDTQEAVFANVLKELEQADTYFASGITFAGDPTPYGGNPDKWRRAVNSFRLKVLQSLSLKENSFGAKAKFAEIVAKGNILQESTGYWGLVYSSINRHPMYDDKENPLFNSRTIISSFLIDNLKAVNDRRLFYFADPAAAALVLDKTLTRADEIAYVGVDVTMEYAKMNNGHDAGKYSLLNKRYGKEQASEPRMLITFAEQQLILAEAVVEGWITGSAKDYYESGVSAALKSMMSTNSQYVGKPIDANYIANYFTGEAAFKLSPTEQLKQIRMQRYFLQFMQHPQTSYFEYRRHGYPVFPINPTTSLNKFNPNALPVRWMYPTRERDNNKVNLFEALDRQFVGGEDEINNKFWLLK